jgi:hypothetical protein
MDRIAGCAKSCATIISKGELNDGEIPLVIGSLIVALSDHSGRDMETIIGVCASAARQLRDATPEERPGKEVAA